MQSIAEKNIFVRLAVLAGGFALIYGLVYAAGKLLVPITDPYDKMILAAINPDHYAPGLDELFRAINDYTNPVILLPLLSWFLAAFMYRFLPTRKIAVAAGLVVVDVLFFVFFFACPLLFTDPASSPDKFLGIFAFLILMLLVLWIVAMLLYRVLPDCKKIIVGLLAVEMVVVAVFAALGKMWPNTVYPLANVMEVVAFLAVFAFAAYLFHKMDKAGIRRVTRVLGLVLLAGLLADFGATQPIKKAVARPRPFNDANKPWNQSVRVIPDELLRGNNSFPSGHTSGTFALLTPLFWFVRDKRGRAGLLTWATLQGVGRVYTAAHFPFCVLMGGLLGFTVGTLVFFTLGGPSLWPDRAQKPEAAG